MRDLTAIVRAALDSDRDLARDEVASWCQTARDLDSLALLYRLTDEAYERIRPELGQQETCTLIRRYLLECVRLDPQAEGILGRYEAAEVLLNWLWHLSSLPGTEAALREVGSGVTELYLAGDHAVREAIETGFLEHALEEEEYRPLFASWAEHDQLKGAWAAALEWGEAHPGFTRELRRGFVGE